MTQGHYVAAYNLVLDKNKGSGSTTNIRWTADLLEISPIHILYSLQHENILNLPALIMHSLFLISYRIKMSSVIVQNSQNTQKRWYLPKKAYYAYYTWSEK